MYVIYYTKNTRTRTLWFIYGNDFCFVFQYYEYKDTDARTDDKPINDFAKIIDRLIFFILLMIILICIAVGY